MALTRLHLDIVRPTVAADSVLSHGPFSAGFEAAYDVTEGKVSR